MSVRPPVGDPALTVDLQRAAGHGRGSLLRAHQPRSGRNRLRGPFLGRTSVPPRWRRPEAQCDDTVGYWRDWLSTGTFPDHPWRSYIERSALTLKGLSYAPTGAIMAAATTSLPETPGGARNWDYRYTWIRDSSFMLRSLYRLGFEWEAIEYFAFVLEAVGGWHPV